MPLNWLHSILLSMTRILVISPMISNMTKWDVFELDFCENDEKRG